MLRNFTILALGYEERVWVRPAKMPPFSELKIIQHTLADELGITGAIGDVVQIDVSVPSEVLGRHIGAATLYPEPMSGGLGNAPADANQPGSE